MYFISHLRRKNNPTKTAQTNKNNKTIPQNNGLTKTLFIDCQIPVFFSGTGCGATSTTVAEETKDNK